MFAACSLLDRIRAMLTKSGITVAEVSAHHIMSIQTGIDVLNQHINDYAKLYIPDFHFMSHKVSTFWRCSGSPIGMCVFRIDNNGIIRECYYCGGQQERK